MSTMTVAQSLSFVNNTGCPVASVKLDMMEEKFIIRVEGSSDEDTFRILQDAEGSYTLYQCGNGQIDHLSPMDKVIASKLSRIFPM